jgi:hypothetical protein
MRITVLDDKPEQRLMVEGKLTGPYIPELESAWNLVRRNARRQPIVVDIGGVTRIDANAEAALITMLAEGARLTARGCYLGYLVKQLTKRARKARLRRHRRDGERAKDSDSANEPSS